MKRILLVKFLTVFILLTACTSDPSVSTPQQPASIRSTITPTATTSSIPTIRSSDTAVPEPTSTTMPTKTPLPTRTPTATFTPLPTATSTHQVLETFVSPDGKWTATVEEDFLMKGDSGDVNDISIWVRENDGETEWLVEVYRADGWLSGGLKPLHWSATENALYYTYTVGGDGCYPSGPYSGLFRFNLATGDNAEIFPRREVKNFIVSPDGEKMAVIFEEPVIQIFEFSSGQIQNIHFQFDLEANVVNLDLFWSPDSQWMIVEAKFDPCINIFPLLQVYRVHAETLEKTLLLESDYEVEADSDMILPLYGVRGWPEMDVVVLSRGGQKSYLNPWTGEITSENDATETPTPIPATTPQFE